jgi:hypothetical protein
LVYLLVGAKPVNGIVVVGNLGDGYVVWFHRYILSD